MKKQATNRTTGQHCCDGRHAGVQALLEGSWEALEREDDRSLCARRTEKPEVRQDDVLAASP